MDSALFILHDFRDVAYMYGLLDEAFLQKTDNFGVETEANYNTPLSNMATGGIKRCCHVLLKTKCVCHVTNCGADKYKVRRCWLPVLESGVPYITTEYIIQ